MSLADDELDRRMTEAFAALDDITVQRRADAPARRRSRVRPVLLASGCVAALAVAVAVVASRREQTPVRQAGATVTTPLATSTSRHHHSAARRARDAAAGDRRPARRRTTCRPAPGLRELGQRRRPVALHHQPAEAVRQRVRTWALPGDRLRPTGSTSRGRGPSSTRRTASTGVPGGRDEGRDRLLLPDSVRQGVIDICRGSIRHIRTMPIDNLPPIGDDGAVFRVARRSVEQMQSRRTSCSSAPGRC